MLFMKQTEYAPLKIGSIRRSPTTSTERGLSEAMSDLRTQPSMGAAAGTVVAMFETYDRALAARDVLVSAGIDRSRIEILAQSGTAQDASFHYERNDEGIWGAIKKLFMPDDDSLLYA